MDEKHITVLSLKLTGMAHRTLVHYTSLKSTLDARWANEFDCVLDMNFVLV